MRGEGSGFIVSPDGYIVTNAHVVDGASQVTVKLTDRREFTAKVVGADKRTDIALLKIAATNLPAVDLSNPPSVKPGQWVIAIGSPFGFENSVSAGIVSGVHRALPGGQMTPFIQTDVAVNPGNSGGPLVNAAGQVVGVNSQIYSRSGGFMGLSFAIPAKVAENVAQQLKAHGKVSHGRLGIGIQGLDQTLAESFGLPDSNGALVGSVEKGSPADKAGFKTGDIIRKIDDVAVTDSTDVTSRIGNMAPGKKIDVEIWRDRKPMTLTATIGSWGSKEQVASAGTSDASQGNKLGVAVRPLTPDEKREVGHDGLVVENASGPAADAGIQPGDVIVRRRLDQGDDDRRPAASDREGGQERRAADRAQRAADLRSGESGLTGARRLRAGDPSDPGGRGVIRGRFAFARPPAARRPKLGAPRSVPTCSDADAPLGPRSGQRANQPSRTPSRVRIISSGQKRVKPLWSRFAPTNAVNHSQFELTNSGLPGTPSASEISTNAPAKMRTIRLVFIAGTPSSLDAAHRNRFRLTA